VSRQRSRPVRRHGGLDQAEQIARVARAPTADECRPGERRIAHEIRAVTAGAIRLERGTSGVGLIRGEWSCAGWLLPCDEQDAACEECGECEEERSNRTGHRRTSSGLLQEPAPEIAAIWSDALLTMKLDIELALPQRFDLRGTEIDRPGQRAARALADCEVGNGGTARALGDTLMETSDGCGRGETFERSCDGQLTAAERAGGRSLAGDVGTIGGAGCRYPAKPRREFLSALRGERDEAGHECGGDRHCHDALSQCHSHSSGGSLPRESLSLRLMDAPLDAEFLQMVRHRLLDEFPGQIRACLDALNEDDL